MEEILGAHNDEQAFTRYLSRWREIMAGRIAQATAAIGAIPGVEGLILAGSNGTGQPWPLSDIDLIPIYADAAEDEIGGHIETARLTILGEWSAQGWRTGLDVGRLRFGAAELDAVFAAGDPDPLPLLVDDRWYHAIDKAYGGRALLDRDGKAARLVAWLTARRFAPEVVASRLARSAREARASLDLARALLDADDRAGAFAALLKGIQWHQVHLMEGWGERDNSLGRFGTRFEHLAERHGMRATFEALNALAGLERDKLGARLEIAPAWVHERRDRSWRARRHVGEELTPLQSDRDVLRVCVTYELRHVSQPPFPAWLGVPDAAELREKAGALAMILAS